VTTGRIDGDRSLSTQLAALIATTMGRVGPRSRVEGFVDQVVADEVYGWAFDPARPDRRLLITATAGGKVISESLADLPRRDLAEARKGDGRHGFRLRLPRDLPPEQRTQVRIEAVARPRNVVLQRGEIHVPEPAPEIEHRSSDQSRPARPSAGFLEVFHACVVKGWAVDPNHPSAPASLDIYDGEVFLGTTTCDRERPKAGRAGARDFTFRIPPGFDPGSGTSLRVRIAGTRLELKRSRHFPGTAPLGEDDAEPAAPSTPIVDTVPSSPSEPSGASPSSFHLEGHARPPEMDVLFLICGSSAADEETVTSCTQQSWESVRLIRADGGGTDLRESLASARIVVLLQPGQRADRELAAALMNAPATADVWTWLTPDRASEAADPAVAARLSGAFNGGLALRSSVLSRYPGDLAATLGDGDLDSIVRWAAEAGLRWDRLAAPFSSGPARKTPGVAPAPALPRRISLAVWSGWDGGIPPCLPKLIPHCRGFQVEILVPAGIDVALENRLAALAPPEAVALTVRRVDGAPAWRALTEAATGQVVLLCHGDIALSDQGEALADVCAWAHDPGIGVATVEIATDDDHPPLAGVTVSRSGRSLMPVNAFDEGRRGRPRPILAATAVFMAVSRSGLAAVGGLGGDLDGGAALVDLSLRLRRVGRVSVLLGQHQILAPRSTVVELLDAPFSLMALAAIGVAAEKAAVDYPPPAGMDQDRSRPGQ